MYVNDLSSGRLEQRRDVVLAGRVAEAAVFVAGDPTWACRTSGRSGGHCGNQRHLAPLRCWCGHNRAVAVIVGGAHGRSHDNRYLMGWDALRGL